MKMLTNFVWMMKGLLFMFNKTTDNKVGTKIEKDEMILIFWED